MYMIALKKVESVRTIQGIPKHRAPFNIVWYLLANLYESFYTVTIHSQVKSCSIICYQGSDNLVTEQISNDKFIPYAIR